MIPPNVEQPQVRECTPKLQDMIAVAKPTLSDAESGEFEELLTEYWDIFAMDNDDYGWTDKVCCCIDMREVRPICETLRRLPLAEQADVWKMLEDM
jgi:hypothetical protein